MISMSSVTLWLNRNIASSYNVLESIREALQPGEDWRIVTSHPYRCSSVFRLSDAHDEVLYVIRKPEDRFARVV